MRRISFEAKDIFGNDLGKRTITLGSSVGNTFSSGEQRHEEPKEVK